MPTEECKRVLDREVFAAGHRPLIELITPALREAINYSARAWLRCGRAGEYSEDLHSVVPLMLFRHVIEMTDGIEVLVASSCAVPAVPVLRSSFEALLSLEYLLKSDTDRRSLCWLCTYAHQRLEHYERLDPSTPSGRAFAETQAREQAGSGKAHPDVPIAIDSFRALLAKPYLAKVETEYQAQKAKRRNRPPSWYALFDGPRNLREVAAILNQQTHYDILYRNWSRIAHGNDLDSFVATSSSGGRGFKSLRYPKELQIVGSLAVDFITRALFLTVEHYRGGELGLQRWYSEEIKGRRERMLRTLVDFPDVES